MASAMAVCSPVYNVDAAGTEQDAGLICWTKFSCGRLPIVPPARELFLGREFAPCRFPSADSPAPILQRLPPSTREPPYPERFPLRGDVRSAAAVLPTAFPQGDARSPARSAVSGCATSVRATLRSGFLLHRSPIASPSPQTETIVNFLSIGGERSSAGRASVCGTEGRGFKSHRSPQLSY